MPSSELITPVAVGLIALATGWCLLRWLRATVLSLRARLRSRHATRGEHRAERLLVKAGYQISGRQVPLEYVLFIDDDPVKVSLRLDLMVHRGGQRFAVEVKTGRTAPRIDNRATRRQLLEYWMASDVDGLLLVNADARTIQRISFPTDPVSAAADRRAA